MSEFLIKAIFIYVLLNTTVIACGCFWNDTQSKDVPHQLLSTTKFTVRIEGEQGLLNPLAPPNIGKQQRKIVRCIFLAAQYHEQRKYELSQKYFVKSLDLLIENNKSFDLKYKVVGERKVDGKTRVYYDSQESLFTLASRIAFFAGFSAYKADRKSFKKESFNLFVDCLNELPQLMLSAEDSIRNGDFLTACKDIERIEKIIHSSSTTNIKYHYFLTHMIQYSYETLNAALNSLSEKTKKVNEVRGLRKIIEAQLSRNLFDWPNRLTLTELDEWTG